MVRLRVNRRKPYPERKQSRTPPQLFLPRLWQLKHFLPLLLVGLKQKCLFSFARKCKILRNFVNFWWHSVKFGLCKIFVFQNHLKLFTFATFFTKIALSVFVKFLQNIKFRASHHLLYVFSWKFLAKKYEKSVNVWNAKCSGSQLLFIFTKFFVISYIFANQFSQNAKTISLKMGKQTFSLQP